MVNIYSDDKLGMNLLLSLSLNEEEIDRSKCVFFFACCFLVISVLPTRLVDGRAWR